jgi:uncharacterized protein HemX
MSISEAVTRPLSEGVSSTSGAVPTSGDAEASPSGGGTAALVVAVLLALGLAGAVGYTQWWVPREQARQVAQLQHEHCLVEVKAYLGKHSYKARLAQCNAFVKG